jgi:hypothetical protein
MNKTFHSVWNVSKQVCVVAVETVSAKGSYQLSAGSVQGI